MTDASSNDDSVDPFQDPAEPIGQSLIASDVLTVDRNATLTLGTDSLVVLDEGLRNQRAASNCCGLFPHRSKTTRAIPFYNVLWAELSGFDVTIRYAQPAGKNSCAPACVYYTISDKNLHAHASRWIERLLDRAYPAPMKRRKTMKVLVNPFGGQGYAAKLWTSLVEPIFAAAKCHIDVERTAYRGHAVEIAEKIDIEAYDVIACASGDGLPHEAFNGLANRPDARKALRAVAVVQIPCGSGNAMSLNLNGTDSPSLAAVAIVKGLRAPLDLVAVTQGNQRYYSFLSQGVGIVAETDLGTESLRWMGGFRFTWGFLVRLLGKNVYPAEVAVVVDSDDKHTIKESYYRTRSEHTAAKAKDLARNDLQQHTGTEGLSLADFPLQYGTVQDELHPSFQVQDMPTLGNFYVGNMCWMSADLPFFATALPADGKMDMVNVSGLTPRGRALRMLISAADGSLIDFPEVSYRKVLAYRITPRMKPTPPRRKLRAKFGQWLGGAAKQKEGLIAIDGERVPFEPFQAEVIQGLATVLSKNGAFYEFDGPVDK